MPIDLQEYKELYLQTSAKLLVEIRSDLAAYREDPTVITTLHRNAHSLKSQSLVMGYTQIGLASKILESSFKHVKEGNLTLTHDLQKLIENTLTTIQRSLADTSGDSSEATLAECIKQIEAATEMRLLD